MAIADLESKAKMDSIDLRVNRLKEFLASPLENQDHRGNLSVLSDVAYIAQHHVKSQTMDEIPTLLLMTCDRLKNPAKTLELFSKWQKMGVPQSPISITLASHAAKELGQVESSLQVLGVFRYSLDNH